MERRDLDSSIDSHRIPWTYAPRAGFYNRHVFKDADGETVQLYFERYNHERPGMDEVLVPFPATIHGPTVAMFVNEYGQLRDKASQQADRIKALESAQARLDKLVKFLEDRPVHGTRGRPQVSYWDGELKSAIEASKGGQ